MRLGKPLRIGTRVAIKRRKGEAPAMASIHLRNRWRDRNRVQIAKLRAERAASDGLQAARKHQVVSLFPVKIAKGKFPDTSHALRQVERLDTYSEKCLISNLSQPLREGDRLQVPAFHKGSRLDPRHAGRNGDRFQFRIILKCIGSNDLQRGRQRNRSDFVKAIESAMRSAGHTLFNHNAGRRFPQPAPRIGTVFICRLSHLPPPADGQRAGGAVEAPRQVRAPRAAGRAGGVERGALPVGRLLSRLRLPGRGPLELLAPGCAAQQQRQRQHQYQDSFHCLALLSSAHKLYT